MVVPDYYQKFQCIAGACRHNCCIGWEIDIDDETLDRYRAIPDEAGVRLRSWIAGDPPHFLLDGEMRCPCLTGENLCSLILTLGESYLCQICRDHPRYRNFWPGQTEAGLGASCEAAARLMLSWKAPPVLIPDGSAIADDGARELYTLRKQLIAAAYDQSCEIEEAEERILCLAETALPARTLSEWAVFYRDLERLDDGWTAVLRAIEADISITDVAGFARHMAARQMEYRHMLAYFLYRHVPEALDDGDPSTKAAFAVLSCRLLRAAGAVCYAKNGAFSFDDQVELFRMYSGEIEYSEENLDALYNALWER